MRDFLRFWWSCIRIATKGSAEFANDWQWLLGVPVLAGLLVYWGAPEVTFLKNTILNSVLAAGIVFAITFGVRLLCKLLVAPVQLHREGQQTVAELQRNLDKRAELQAALDVLWALRSEGISIRNEPVRSEAGCATWQANFSAWRERVLAEAAKVNVNLRNYLERIDQMTPGRADILLEAFDGEHRRLVNICSEILRRLTWFLVRDLRP